MTPEENQLLHRVIKLSEENNRIIKSVRRHMRWSMAWGFVKFLLIAIPLIVGYLYVEPHFDSATQIIEHAKEMIDSIK